MKKKSFFLLFSLMLLSGFWISDKTDASKVEPSTIMVNDIPVQTPSFIQEGRTMVHSRFFEQAGVAVSWDREKESVVLKGNGIAISFPSGERAADILQRGAEQWQREHLEVPTVNHHDKTYIPLRYAVEKLGMKISYNSQHSLVSIQAPTTLSRSSKEKVNEDLYWLYRITEAEASGESYQGKVAVASSILNRVKSPDWPNTIKEVIFQVTNNNGVNHYQYSPVASKIIYRVTPSADTIKAVQEALKGNDPSEGATVFYNPDKTKNEWVRSRTVTATIGNHVFAK